MSNLKIALGGGCHWCTEAIFQSLIGVEKVEQGYVASRGKNDSFSEAVIVHFNPDKISMKTIIEIHLHTHKSTVTHTMRDRYRSAIYFFSEMQRSQINIIIEDLKKEFGYKLITKIMDFKTFKPSREQIANYYFKNPRKPFCEKFINPKLELLLKQFSSYVNNKKLSHLVI